ncbi:branched-chain amino acid transaminase [bacterium]|nr:branched-chain amino acid transaminase [bacterium]
MTAFKDIPGDTQVWKNGTFIDWKDANVHVMSHAVHYASSIFEGVRCYKTAKGSSIFRLEDHIRRLYDSAKIYRMSSPIAVEEFIAAVPETVRRNGFDACYIRPVVFRGAGTFGVNGMDNPVESYICAWRWGQYLGDEALEKGVNVMISTWNRMAANTLPAMAKCAANYANSQLIKMEALLNGYAEGIALDTDGFISEGSGENIFVIRDNTVYTPPTANSVLPGITRDSVMEILKELRMPLVEQRIPREMLYIADEIFFTGTAAEVTPVASVDKIPVGSGSRGPVTKAVQDRYFAYINGDLEDQHGWHTFL